jgi:hypothetical protein
LPANINSANKPVASNSRHTARPDGIQDANNHETMQRLLSKQAPYSRMFTGICPEGAHKPQKASNSKQSPVPIHINVDQRAKRAMKSVDQLAIYTP